MQKLITENKKFAMLAVLAVLIVTFVTLSNSPKLAEAPTDSNLAAAGATTSIAGDAVIGARVAPVTVSFFPSINSKNGVLYSDYYISIVDTLGAIVLEFDLNISTKVGKIPVAVEWSGIKTDKVALRIDNELALSSLRPDQTYDVRIAARNSLTKALGESLVKPIVTSQITTRPASTESSLMINGSAERQTNTFFTRASANIKIFFTNILDFFARLFGGSSAGLKTNTSGGTGGSLK